MKSRSHHRHQTAVKNPINRLRSSQGHEKVVAVAEAAVEAEAARQAHCAEAPTFQQYGVSQLPNSPSFHLLRPFLQTAPSQSRGASHREIAPVISLQGEIPLLAHQVHRARETLTSSQDNRSLLQRCSARLIILSRHRCVVFQHSLWLRTAHSGRLAFPPQVTKYLKTPRWNSKMHWTG